MSETGEKTSSQLMAEYGTTYSGKDILDLANKGLIDSKEPINMLIYKSLYAQDKKSEDYIEPVSYDELLEFYSPEKNPGRMHSLLVNNEIDHNFSELHQELLDNVSAKSRKDYIKDLVDESKSLASTPADYSNDLLAYVDSKIIPYDTLSGNITPDFLKTKFLDGEISLANILNIYESDTKYFESLKSILTPAEIEKAHEKNEITDDSLMYLPKNNRISYLQKNNIKLTSIMYLYLHCDSMSVTDLKKILSAHNITESLDFYIDEGSSPSRIQELYDNFLIDYGCIKNLITSGIIKNTDIQGFSKDKIYNKIQSSRSLEISGHTNSVPFSTTGAFIKAPPTEKDTQKKSNELYKILGNITDEDQKQLTIISHKDDENKSNFLDGYKILPLKPANLIAFVPSNYTYSTYLMPYQEAAYIMHNKKLPYTFPDNPAFYEIRFSEKQHENILKTVYQIEESRDYLERLGYSEKLNFEEALKIMTEEYIKIRLKGEN